MNSSKKNSGAEQVNIGEDSQTNGRRFVPFPVEEVLNNISDVFITLDINWKITYANKKAEQFIGKQKDFLGEDLLEILEDKGSTGLQEKLLSVGKPTSAKEFDFFDVKTEDWYHLRFYPFNAGHCIYINKITSEKKLLQTLKDTKARSQSFINRTTEGIWRFDFDEPVAIKDPVKKQAKAIYENGYVAECNEIIARMYGFSDCKQLHGVRVKQLLWDNEKTATWIKAFIESGHRLSQVVTKFTKDEQTTYFLHNIVGIIQNQKLVSVWATQRDISSQKQIEEALLKVRNRLNFALAAGSVGTYVWDFKKNKITWTKVQESLYGLKEYSFKGNLDDWMLFIHPDDVPATKKAIEESVSEQKELSVEFRIYWPDKSLHWILSRANTTYDKDGKPVEMSGVNIDISERKFKEQLITENEERFKALVQNSFDIITVFNLDGTITYQSESIERVLGYNAKERLGENIFSKSIVHPEDRELEKQLFKKCIDQPYKYIEGEFRMLHKDGTYRIMEVGCINLINNSSINGIIKNYRDITERRAIEKQKEEFIGIASHELKTPVTSIKGYAQILLDTLLEKNDTFSADLLLRMDHQIDRLTTLIKDLLDVTRITEGQLILKPEEFNINDLVNEAIHDLQITTKRHKITTEMQQIKPIKADKERTLQVIVNLLSNAIKYSPGADKIIVSTSANENEVTVCVKDFGIGISKDMQKKLFKRFFRVTDETTSTFPGLGLGLFIATEIVRKQNGRIWVESTPNEGSSFSFTLPLTV